MACHYFAFIGAAYIATNGYSKFSIIMLVDYARKHPGGEIPARYCLGKGHIKFFKNKVKYLQKRFGMIQKEMKKRGFRPKARFSIKGIRLVSKVGDIEAYFDEARIGEVLENLIGNATKFTHSGSIVLNAKKRKRDVLVSVKDSGMGIEKSGLKKLFHPFSQIEPSYALHHKGTGLGLSICRLLIGMHCGKIWVESAGRGKGSTVYFTLPLNGKSLNRKQNTDKKEEQ